MPQLTNVGANHSNVGGHSSKGYDISRAGCVVTKKWGPIESIGRGGGTLHWVGQPQTDRKVFGSVSEAKSFVEQEISRKESRGYKRLPMRARIRALRKRA
jgi:hypothetical protein